MATFQTVRIRLLPLMAFVWTIASLSGCGDTAARDCSSCSNLDLKPACEEAAAQCDTVPDNVRQMCIDEALALCT